VLYDEVERAALSGDMARLDRSLADMKDRFGSTVYAGQAGLLAAKTYYDKGNVDASRAALSWVVDKASDDAYQSIAKLRLAGILFETKAYDEALKLASGSFPKEFAALAADRRGDILSVQGKKAEARAEYQTAYKGFDERSEYRRLVEVKLNALGTDPAAEKSAAPAPNPEVKK
jgi:predicted negative regulator of RcsB-dependent stress response